jgi:hypothetical protein
MADEKTPQTPPADDLKARLRLSSKSLRQQQQEEEERRRTEDEARKNAEAEKQRREKERQQQFSLAGGGPGKTEWSAAWEVPSDDELKKLEALPDKGQGGRRLVVGIVVTVALLAALAFGYYFGRAFFGRSLENGKIQEARDLIAWVESRKVLFDAVEDHKKKIDELVETFAKPNLTAQFQLQKLYEFIAHCEQFMEANKPFTAREMFGADIRNPAVATEVIGYIDALNRLYMLTDQMLRERDILMVIGSGQETEEEAAAAEKMMATLVFESAPKGDGDAKLPWNEGDVIVIPQESWQQLTRLDPDPVDGTTAASAAVHFTLPVLKGPQAEKTDVDTANIVEFDAWPLVRRERGGYRLALLERAKTTLLDMKSVADKVAWSRVEKEIRESADKEFYFTL